MTCYEKKVRHVKILARCGMLWHAAACFNTPTNSSQNLALRHAAACCSMLLPLVLALNIVPACAGAPTTHVGDSRCLVW